MGQTHARFWNAPVAEVYHLWVCGKTWAILVHLELDKHVNFHFIVFQHHRVESGARDLEIITAYT